MVNIRYLKAFPYINNLEKLVSFERELDLVYSFLALAFFSWLFCFINGIGGKRKKAEQSFAEPGYPKPGGRITMAELMEKGHTDYDALVEEYYAQGWDKDDPSWKCICGHWSDGLFCQSYGRKRNQ